MLHRLDVLPSLRFLRSISLVAVGLLIGVTLSSSDAASGVTSPQAEVQEEPPVEPLDPDCEQQALAYAIALAEYEAALELLNDAYDALADCQSEQVEEYAPSPTKSTQLATMQSVVE